MMTKLTYLGQQIEYDAETKLVKTTIREPFHKASEMLGWSGKSSGLGFNHKIIEFILTHQADLLVFVESEKSSWYINFTELRKFLQSGTRCTYPVKNGKTVSVIPWDMFKWTESQ